MKLIQIAVGVLAAFLIVTGFNFAYAGDSNSGSVAGAQSQAELTYKDQSTSIVVDRDFAPTGVPVVAGTNPLFVPNTGSDVSFRRVMELIQFGDVFSESSLRNLAAGGDVELNYTPVHDFEKPAIKLSDGKRYIRIVIEIVPGFKMAAPFDAEADDFETTSFQLIAEMALKALDNGDNVLLVTKEGWKDKVGANGWGIGTHTTGAAVDATGSLSAIAGGGLGFSSNEVGSEMLPWIKGYSGCLPYELSPGMSAGKVQQSNHYEPIER